VDLAIAHARDVQIEKQYGVRYLTYWFDPNRGTLSAWLRAEGLKGFDEPVRLYGVRAQAERAASDHEPDSTKA